MSLSFFYHPSLIKIFAILTSLVSLQIKQVSSVGLLVTLTNQTESKIQVTATDGIPDINILFGDNPIPFEKKGYAHILGMGASYLPVFIDIAPSKSLSFNSTLNDFVSMYGEKLLVANNAEAQASIYVKQIGKKVESNKITFRAY